MLERLGVDMAVVIRGCTGKAEEFVEAMLQRMEFRQQPEVPFAHHCGFVACIFQQAGDGRWRGCEAGGLPGQWLVEPGWIACGVSAGHECDTCWRAHRCGG